MLSSNTAESRQNRMNRSQEMEAEREGVNWDWIMVLFKLSIYVSVYLSVYLSSIYLLSTFLSTYILLGTELSLLYYFIK
jgi:hypothetical protein